MQQKLQVVVQEHADLQKQVLSLQQQQLQAAADTAHKASTAAAAAAAATGPSAAEQELQQQRQGSLGTQPGSSIQDNALQEEAEAAAAESGLAGLGLDTQEMPGDRSGSRFSLASVQSLGSAGTAGALSRRVSSALGPNVPTANGAAAASTKLLRGGSGISSASGSPLASQAGLQQQQSLSGLSFEGQLQLQRTVQQLQQELAAVTKARDAAAEQLYQMVRQVDEAAAVRQEVEAMKQQQAELQHKVRQREQLLGDAQ